ncbi:type II toxin-antitoxin system RelE/ParE family toxin [Fibrobacterota bacterium]
MDYEVMLIDQAVGFLRKLSLNMRAKVFRTIELLKTFGPNLTEPYSKSMTGYRELKELRVKLGNTICRLFYFHFKGNIYIVTSGFIKKKQKTDKREIDKAVKLMNEFKEGEKK